MSKTHTNVLEDHEEDSLNSFYAQVAIRMRREMHKRWPDLHDLVEEYCDSSEDANGYEWMTLLITWEAVVEDFDLYRRSIIDTPPPEFKRVEIPVTIVVTTVLPGTGAIDKDSLVEIVQCQDPVYWKDQIGYGNFEIGMRRIVDCDSDGDPIPLAPL